MIKFKHIYKSVIVIIFAITLFACEGNYNNIQKLNLKDDAPVGEGKGINMKYTDSGKVVTNLIAERFLDYRNFQFPYIEFPEGITVYYWKEGKKSTITSDYAIQFQETGIVDLRKNVVIFTSDSTTLKAEQLYWDQENQWVFTDQPYQIIQKDGSYNDGAHLDSNEEFTKLLSRKNEGVQLIDKKNTPNAK